MMHSTQARPIVLFDGSCPLCRREIAFYRRRPAASELDWVDVSKVTDLESRFDVTFEQAMRRFHVRDQKGKWQTGAYAFAELWSYFPGWRWIALALRFLRLLPLVDWVYSRFAAWRLKRQCGQSCARP